MTYKARYLVKTVSVHDHGFAQINLMPEGWDPKSTETCCEHRFIVAAEDVEQFEIGSLIEVQMTKVEL